MQQDDTANPGMLWVLEGESALGREGRHVRRSPAPTATATPSRA